MGASIPRYPMCYIVETPFVRPYGNRACKSQPYRGNQTATAGCGRGGESRLSSPLLQAFASRCTWPTSSQASHVRQGHLPRHTCFPAWDAHKQHATSPVIFVRKEVKVGESCLTPRVLFALAHAGWDVAPDGTRHKSHDFRSEQQLVSRTQVLERFIL